MEKQYKPTPVRDYLKKERKTYGMSFMDRVNQPKISQEEEDQNRENVNRDGWPEKLAIYTAQDTYFLYTPRHHGFHYKIHSKGNDIDFWEKHLLEKGWVTFAHIKHLRKLMEENVGNIKKPLPVWNYEDGEEENRVNWPDKLAIKTAKDFYYLYDAVHDGFFYKFDVSEKGIEFWINYLQRKSWITSDHIKHLIELFE